MDAADIDDHGNVFALLDALELLLWAFDDGDIPPDPGPDDCGSDPTEDDVGCLTVPEGCQWRGDSQGILETNVGTMEVLEVSP